MTERRFGRGGILAQGEGGRLPLVLAQPPRPERRERLRRAAEDGERLYRVRMHGNATVADDNRIDGILTLDLMDALGFVDELLREREELISGHWSRTSGPEWTESESGYGNF